MYLTNLARVLRAAGLKVEEVGDWTGRGHGGLISVRGIMWHHTAGAKRGNYPSLGVVRDGRSGLPGPLSQLGLGRDGTWYVIAAGRAWHAGEGSASFVPANRGNDYLIGIEAENSGTSSDPWPEVQLESYRRGTAALLNAYNLSANRMIGHKEWAPSRKIDPHSLNMDSERNRVAAYMRNPNPREWDELATKAEVQEAVGDALREWGKARNLNSDKETDLRTLIQWGHKHASDIKAMLPALLDDQAILTQVIQSTVAANPGADPALLKAAFVEALLELLEENDDES